MKTVDIWTDGACCGNPGPGGWAAILQYKHHEKIISGAIKHSTNNRMEMVAVIEAIKAVTMHCYINIYSDSAYVVNAINFPNNFGGRT